MYIKKNLKFNKILKKMISFTNFYKYDVKNNIFIKTNKTEYLILKKINQQNKSKNSKNYYNQINNLNNIENIKKLYEKFYGFEKSKPLLEQYVTDKEIIYDIYSNINLYILNTKENDKKEIKDLKKKNEIELKTNSNKFIQIDFGSGTGFLSLFSLINEDISKIIMVETDLNAIESFVRNLIILTNYIYDSYNFEIKDLNNKFKIKKSNKDNNLNSKFIEKLEKLTINLETLNVKKTTLSKIVFDVLEQLDSNFNQYTKKEKSIKIFIFKRLLKKIILFNEDLEFVDLKFLNNMNYNNNNNNNLDYMNNFDSTKKIDSNNNNNKNNNNINVNDNNNNNNNIQIKEGFNKIFVQNPPFGSKKKSEDVFFLNKCLSYFNNNDIIFTIHKTSTKDYIQQKIKQKSEDFSIELKDYKYKLDNTMWYHKEKIKIIETSLFKIQ